MDRLGPIEGWLEGAADTEGWAEGWLDGADDTLGGLLGTKLGTPLAVGFALGWLDGAAETDGLPVSDVVGLVEGLKVGIIVDGADDGTDELHAILGTKASISEDNSAKSVTSATCPSLLSPAM